jgi:hypothetical protein
MPKYFAQLSSQYRRITRLLGVWGFCSEDLEGSFELGQPGNILRSCSFPGNARGRRCSCGYR